MTRVVAGRTSLFVAGLAAWTVVLNQPTDLAGFEDRIVSAASLAGVDVEARTRTYALALLAFLAAGAVTAWLVSRIERVCGADTRAELEDASLVGIALLVMAAAGSAEQPAVQLLACLLAAFALARACDAVLFRAPLHPRAGHAFALTACGAFGIASVLPWRGSCLATAGVALAAHVAMQIWARRASDPRATDRGLVVLTTFSLAPLLMVGREELRLDGLGETASTFAVGLLAVIATVVLARQLGRGKRFDVDRALSRCALPGLLLGFSFLAYWVVQREPLPEMFEGANAGLTVQQWFEHGRLPFLDTFSVHGLSDSGMGLLYAAVHGWSGTTWQQWDLVPYVLASVAAYAVTARVTGSALLAFAVFAASPFAKDSFPQMVSIAVVFTFVAVSAARARKARTLAWTALGWIAFVAWRLDLGSAALVALAATVAAAIVIEPDRRVALGRRLAAFLGVLALVALAGVLVGWIRGVDVSSRVQDLLGVVGSNQSFGRVSVATRLDSGVTLRLFAVPAILIAVLVAAVARARRREAVEGVEAERGFAVLALVYLGAFSLTIATRGLVRHTFVENEGEYATAFGFAVLSLAPCVLLDGSRRALAWGAFLALHVLLPLALRVGQGPQQDGGVRGNLFARVAHRLDAWRPLPGDAAAIERSPVDPGFRARNIEPLRDVRERCLAPGETFLDLSGSPMLYVYSGARSPHWLNHVMAVQGEAMQRRFVGILGDEGVPLVVMRQDAAQAAREGVRADVDVDGVPLEMWHSLIFARAQSTCVPFRAAGRWDVWARRAWLPPASSEPLDRAVSVLANGGSAPAAIEAAPGETVVVRLSSSALSRGVVRASWTRHEAGFAAAESRSIGWDAAWTTRDLPIVGEGRAYRVEGLRVESGGGAVLSAIEVGLSRDPALATVGARTAVPMHTHWGRLARAFGEHDPFPRVPGVTLHGAGEPPVHAVPDANGRPSARVALTPLEPGSGAAVLVMELESAGAGSTRVTVTYGAGEARSGSFDFDVARGGRARCAIRPGIQPLWHVRPNDWLEFSTDGAPLEIHSVALTRDAD